MQPSNENHRNYRQASIGTTDQPNDHQPWTAHSTQSIFPYWRHFQAQLRRQWTWVWIMITGSSPNFALREGYWKTKLRPTIEGNCQDRKWKTIMYAKKILPLRKKWRHRTNKKAGNTKIYRQRHKNCKNANLLPKFVTTMTLDFLFCELKCTQWHDIAAYHSIIGVTFLQSALWKLLELVPNFTPMHGTVFFDRSQQKTRKNDLVYSN